MYGRTLANTDTIISQTQIDQIWALTDHHYIDRDVVIIPLVSSENGMEMVLPDGKLLIRPPGQSGFQSWFNGLAARLASLDLRKIRKALPPHLR
jgi:hypothetical protein